MDFKWTTKQGNKHASTHERKKAEKEEEEEEEEEKEEEEVAGSLISEPYQLLL